MLQWFNAFAKALAASPWDIFTKALWALCLWREARGEGPEGLRAVAHVINNRHKKWNKSILEVLTADGQFTSINPVRKTYDPQLDLYPLPPDPVFETCMNIVQNIDSDPDLTLGATYYMNPATATSETFKKDISSGRLILTRKIGRHNFYKEP